MPDIDLEQVKKLAEQLSPEDRARLFKHLAELPDSLTKPVEFPPSKPPIPSRFQERPITFKARAKVESGEVIYYLDDLEVFRASLNAENYASVHFEKLKSDNKYMDGAVSEDLRSRFNTIVREVAAEAGEELSDERLKEIEIASLRRLAEDQLRKSLETGAKRMADNLPQAVALLIKNLAQATYLSSFNTLLENIGLSEQKYTADEMKAVIFHKERDAWGKLKKIIGATPGGPRNVKVADLSEKTKIALGRRYQELKDNLTTIKRDAKAIASTTSDWRPLILRKYPVLEAHPDQLDRIAPYDEPNNADASDGDIAPWEIAIEIAARETLPGYKHYGASSASLRKVAILPNKDKASPKIKT